MGKTKFDEKKKEDAIQILYNSKKTTWSQDLNTLIPKKRVPYREKMEDFTLKEKQDNLRLKKGFASYIREILLLQSGFLYVLIIFQGFNFANFELDNYLFYILVAGTLIQSYFLVRIIVSHLFPNN